MLKEAGISFDGLFLNADLGQFASDLIQVHFERLVTKKILFQMLNRMLIIHEIKNLK
jgi:hypothetical protein